MIPLLVLVSLSQAEIPGLGREGIDARTRGLVLLGELGCTACHDGGDRPILHKTAPDLSRVGERVRPGALGALIATPHRLKPETTMPRIDLEGEEVVSLVHYLVSASPGMFHDEAVDETAAARGGELYRTVGCVACHDPGRKPVTGKYGLKSLAAFLEAPHEVRPAGRMPSLGLTGREALDLANFLSQGNDPSDPLEPDAAQARKGRRVFVDRNCIRCHALGDDPPAANFTPLDRADPAQGCLSKENGGWPAYGLSDSQIRDIRAALAEPGFRPTPEQQIRQSLVALNCVACHARGDLGGVTEARNEFFTTDAPVMGETGRLPPPLTGTGAKLQKEWIRKTIAYGHRIRPYVKTRMPGFGNDHGARLAELFAKVDTVPPVAFEEVPKDRKKARAVRDLGRNLLGEKGMKCTACHTFAGRQATTMQAVDLVDTTTKRLRKEWFAHYMLNPAQFRPGTIMPTFFPGGKSVIKDVLDGDPNRQLHAIWTYLAEGRNQGPPSGYRRPSMEIVVGDEAVMLRRSAQNTGKRGISVGYPKKVNLTFDAETIAVNQVWHGRFIDPAGAWSGQGSGQVRPLGEGRVQLPKGPAFIQLPDADAPWTTKTSRELGYRFRGYRLDTLQRPTFLYDFGDVRITDTPTDLEEEGRPVLRRTITLTGGAGTLYFRAAVDKDIKEQGEGVVHVGRSLEIRVPAPILRKDELLVPVTFKDGRATLVIEYRWRESTK